MLKNYITLSTLALFFCLAISCKKEENPNLIEATIIEDTNGTAGCKWFVNVSGTEHIPTNLTSEFQEHFLKVKVDFTLGEDSDCGGKLSTPKEIMINEIEKN